jgi:pyruvate/2-oxoacid:ferredoxin oxidoreductase beta subunit
MAPGSTAIQGRDSLYTGEAMRTVIPKTQVKNFQLPKMEIMGSGSRDCPGCGVALSMRYALKALGRKTVLVIPASCCSIPDDPFTHCAFNVPVFQTACQRAASAAFGVRSGLDFQGKTDVQIVVWAGDEEGCKIEFQALSEDIKRNENFIYVYLDNLVNDIAETLGPKTQARKSLVEIMVTQGITYAASATVAYPQDFVGKFKKAKRIKGTRLLYLLSPCPPVWKIPENLSVHIARLAVQTRIFPLYEVEKGEKYTLSPVPKKLPVGEFLRPQSRFRNLTKKQVAVIQRRVKTKWECLMKKAGE